MRIPSKNDFIFLPLGGSNEIGMNLNLFGHDGQWLMVDCGITFHDRLGIEIMTPDPTAIANQKDRLVGLVLTHAHEDHIGAIPYLWPYLRCPIYATPFTASILRQKLTEKSWGRDVEIIEVSLSGKIQIGAFEIEFITLTHSIPEPNALAITTKMGTVVHTGDWKIDPSPFIGEVTDQKRLIEIGKQGVLAMICDSTNVFTEGSSGSELGVRTELTRLIAQYPERRVVVACFASNVARLETAIKAAVETGRKVALMGRSIVRMVRAAQENGYLTDVPEFIEPHEARKLAPSKVLLICTGSQGEPRAALTRMANHQHPDFKLGEHDVVFFSSRVIPGNEKSIASVQNMLVEKGVCVVTAYDANIHVSGHPARDELKQMYQWLQPKIVIPVHGEQRHLHEQASLARAEGVPETIIPKNGSMIQMIEGNSHVVQQFDVGRWVYDGGRMVPMDHPTIKDRAKISSQGAVFAVLVTDDYSQLLKPPHLSIVGICIDDDEVQSIERETYRILRDLLNDEFKNEAARLDAVKQVIRKVIKQQFDKKPLVDAHFIVQRYNA